MEPKQSPPRPRSPRFPSARPLGRALKLLAIAALGLAASCGEEAASERHVLLISIDTLRADSLGLYGYPRDTSPFLDRLGNEGVVFEDHHANSNTTLPSHASMLTGLFTPAHGVRDGGTPDSRFPIPGPAVTLAERFKEAGYKTLAITSNPVWLSPAFGFDKGFDEFETSWRPAPRTITGFLNWLDRESPSKSFAFLHFFDVHSDHKVRPPNKPYNSADEFVERFAGDPPEGFTGCTHVVPDHCGSEYLKAVSNGIEPLPEEHLRYLRDLYDAGVAQMDHRLEMMFEELDKRGYLENALIVITSDHGESFWEHETLLHGTHFREVTHVPLVIVTPPEMKIPPRRFSARTQSVDVAPTILELAGLRPFGQGRSLAAAVLRGEEPEPSDVLFHGNVLISQDQEGPFKFERTSGRPTFYDHVNDPLEHENLVDRKGFVREAHPRLMSAHHRLMELFNESLGIHKALGAGKPTDVQLTPEQEEQLRALGYF